MKSPNRLRIIGFIILTLTASSFSQEPSPREQFPAAVAAYQKTPTRETALKVIELYKQLDPPPAVPEEARRPFVMGATVLKKANDKTGAAKAVELFTEAVKTAPWFAEAYYNRALAREIAGQFTEAMDDLKLYLAFALTEPERREAQDKIYSLEADAQLSASKIAEETSNAAAKARNEEALIVPGERIGRIRIGMSLRQVDQILGNAQSSEQFTGGGRGGTYTYRLLTVTYDERFEVYRIKTRSSEFKTKTGVAVGAPIEEARREWGSPSQDMPNDHGLPGERHVSVFVKKTAVWWDTSTGRIHAIEVWPEAK